MGETEYQRDNAVAWGMELENAAKKNGIQFIDASLPPADILKVILS